MVEKKSSMQNLILWVAAILTLIKSAFVEYGYDASYHIALSWRHINGDRLFGEMWEPHQTSSFVLDFLMKVYHVIIPSMTGVALYLQVVGAVAFFCVVYFFYRSLLKFVDKNIATIASVILLVARPKGMTLLEFSNLLVVFSVCLLLCILFVYENASCLSAVLTAGFTCLMLLAYPSTVLFFVPVFVFLIRRNQKCGWTYLFSCITFGAIYVCVHVFQNGFSVFIQNIFNIFGGDATHGVKSLSSFFRFEWDVPYLVNTIFPMMIIAGFFGRKRLNEKEKQVWLWGVLISSFSFVAVALLTNLGIFTIFGYLVLGAAVSVIPLSKMLSEKKEYILVGVCFAIVIVRGLWVINGYSSINGRFITNIENIIREGPAEGIVAPLSIVNETRESLSDWKKNVSEEDSVLAVGDWLVDSIVYLYSEAEVANYSTIDTTTYSDKLEEYWNIYPKKEPSVIAYKSYRGENMPTEDTYIGRLILEKYEPVAIGEQWIFYREKQ